LHLCLWRGVSYKASQIYSGFSKANQLQLASHTSSGFICTTMVDIVHPPAANSSRFVTARAWVKCQAPHWDNAETSIHGRVSATLSFVPTTKNYSIKI
jgi:hypothetical protein